MRVYEVFSSDVFLEFVEFVHVNHTSEITFGVPYAFLQCPVTRDELTDGFLSVRLLLIHQFLLGSDTTATKRRKHLDSLG